MRSKVYFLVSFCRVATFSKSTDIYVLFVPKITELVLQKFSEPISGMVGLRKLGDSSLNRVFNVLLIGLQYTLTFERPGFGQKYLVTVLSKGHSPAVKFTVYNIPIFEIDSNCNSILNKLIAMELLRNLKGR